MASQSASISIGLSLGNTSSKHGAAGAIVTTGVLNQANPYSGGNSVTGNTGRRVPLPKASIPFGTVNAQGQVIVDPAWYQAFDFFFNKQAGGPSAPSVADLSAATISTKDQAIQAQTAVASVSQQVTANAASLGAVVQVAQNNALSGASQIPPVSYSEPNRKGPQP
jgi:hypothetical protein